MMQSSKGRLGLRIHSSSRTIRGRKSGQRRGRCDYLTDLWEWDLELSPVQVERIVDWFNIQPENPVMIMAQETQKKFITATPDELFGFFEQVSISP